MPLLWERDAIALYLQDHPEATAGLPEVLDAGEAVMLASREFPLDPSQQRQLRKLLQQTPR
jgi:hypothetical protein